MTAMHLPIVFPLFSLTRSPTRARAPDKVEEAKVWFFFNVRAPAGHVLQRKLMGES